MSTCYSSTSYHFLYIFPIFNFQYLIYLNIIQYTAEYRRYFPPGKLKWLASHNSIAAPSKQATSNNHINVFGLDYSSPPSPCHLRHRNHPSSQFGSPSLVLVRRQLPQTRRNIYGFRRPQRVQQRHVYRQSSSQSGTH